MLDILLLLLGLSFGLTWDNYAIDKDIICKDTLYITVGVTKNKAEEVVEATCTAEALDTADISAKRNGLVENSRRMFDEDIESVIYFWRNK